MDVMLIKGGSHADERGVVTFYNDFDVSGADRFYTVRSHRILHIRGWIGHRREHKWFTALAGSLVVAVVQPTTGKRRHKIWKFGNSPSPLTIQPCSMCPPAMQQPV